MTEQLAVEVDVKNVTDARMDGTRNMDKLLYLVRLDTTFLASITYFDIKFYVGKKFFV